MALDQEENIESEKQSFPDHLTIGILTSTNKSYNQLQFEQNNALYEGGDLFEALKSEFLYLREIERDNSNAMIGSKGSKLREARLQHATYSNPVAPCIDYMMAAAFQSPPQVIFSLLEKSPAEKAMELANNELESIEEDVVHDKAQEAHLSQIENLDEEYQLKVARELEYYNNLNKCLPELLMDSFLDIVLFGGGYVGVCFPDVIANNRTEQKSSGSLDAELYKICPKDIIDWDCCGKKFTMLKTYCMDMVRKNVYETAQIERHTWTYITCNEIVEYVGEKDVGSQWEKGNDTLIAGVRKATKSEHLPVFKAYLSNNKCLVSRIKHLVIEHFNAEADLAFALHVNSHPHLWFKLNPTHKINEVINSPVTAWMLQAGSNTSTDESVGYCSTTGIEFKNHMEHVVHLEKKITDRLNAAALSIATRDTGGRASAMAKWRDLSPINILLGVYADKIKVMLTEILEYIISIRGDTGRVGFKLIGLNKFDVEGLTKRIEQFEKYFKLPGSKTARKYVAGEIDQGMIVDAPHEVREKVMQESEELDLEAEEVVDEVVDEEKLEEESEEKDEKQDEEVDI